ncbi:DUF5305 family protein [Haloarchaeobius iranensis]|uniref:DUF5305 family protein n=1 Tax=Haloarchaeobius iranensis TaxID=996166 RepID=UPI0011141B2B|nr:DUF5305 family protein [Haloarchaeobius iranensis]
MTRGGTRIRALVADNYRTLLVVCLVASAVAGVVAADAVQPQSTTVTDERTLYEPSAAVSHGADVVTKTPVYDRERLENRPVYFANVSPVISGTVTVGHQGDATLNTTVETAVVLRAVGESDGSGAGDGQRTETTVYWERTVARNTTSATLDGGEQLRVPYAVNATALFDRVDAIQRALDSSAGETQVFLLATVHRRGQVAGRTVDQSEELRVRFTGDGTAVRVEPTGLDASPVTVTERRRVTERPDGPVVAASLVGTGAVWLLTFALVSVGVAVRYRDVRIEPTAPERARAQFESEREEFSEWITVGAVPDAVRSRTVVEVDSLTGLVDVAIDTDSRVIESGDDGRFYVPDGELCYVYDPPPEPTAGDVLAPEDVEAPDETERTFEFPDSDSDGSVLPADGTRNDDSDDDTGAGTATAAAGPAGAGDDEPTVAPEEDD